MSTALDEDLVVLEDLDFDPTCVMCQSAATWIVTFLCCDTSKFTCDRCRKRELAIQKLDPSRTCLHCRFSWDVRDIDNLEWTRI